MWNPGVGDLYVQFGDAYGAEPWPPVVGGRGAWLGPLPVGIGPGIVGATPRKPNMVEFNHFTVHFR